MKFIFGTKKQMTQEFLDTGASVPVTVVAIEPNVVTQVKTKERDGYTAVQVGFGKRRNTTNALRGHTKGIPYRWFREVRLESPEHAIGAALDWTQFAKGDKVHVVGTSKGRGFQGVVKRHHFRGHPATHGHKDQLRMPGSIGSRRQRGGVIERGKRMAGHMGDARVTIKNLEVLRVDSDKKEIWVKGAVPGSRNSLILIKSA